jgi:hypothetical protein
VPADLLQPCGGGAVMGFVPLGADEPVARSRITREEPDPANGPRTMPPGGAKARINGATMATGFCVGWRWLPEIHPVDDVRRLRARTVPGSRTRFATSHDPNKRRYQRIG